jgi:hypothetical protein
MMRDTMGYHGVYTISVKLIEMCESSDELETRKNNFDENKCESIIHLTLAVSFYCLFTVFLNIYI